MFTRLIPALASPSIHWQDIVDGYLVSEVDEEDDKEEVVGAMRRELQGVKAELGELKTMMKALLER